MFTAIIGQGTSDSTTIGSSPTFDVIDWGASNHLLKVEIDYGSGLVDMGTTAFMSVPYALSSGSAANAVWSDVGNTIAPSNSGGTVTTVTDININGITVGKGGGNISTNTASGNQALSSNTNRRQQYSSGI